MDPNAGDDTDRQHAPRRPFDPAAPHTAPFPTHVPRWMAWLLLVAFAVSGTLCTRAVVGG